MHELLRGAVREGRGYQGDVALSPSISADCQRIAFTSDGLAYVYDRSSGKLERPDTLAPADARTAVVAGTARISGDGRVVAFTAAGSADGSAARREWVVVRSIDAPGERRLTTPGASPPRAALAGGIALSFDGTVVAWDAPAPPAARSPDAASRSTRVLVVAEAGEDRDERESGLRVIAATAAAGELGGPARRPVLSRDGRYVAFASAARGGATDVYLYDRRLGDTTHVSVSAAGAAANGDSDFADVSDDGRYVAFASNASNLVENDINRARDVFVHDSARGVTRRISASRSGDGGDAESDFPSISGDGRWIAFASRAANLVEHDRNDAWDVFLHDRVRTRTERLSVAADGGEGNGDSGAWQVAISAGADCVTFSSTATNLAHADAQQGPGPRLLLVRLRDRAMRQGVRP